jgi:hypothetical protein
MLRFVWAAGLVVLLAGGVGGAAIVSVEIVGEVTNVFDHAGVLGGTINAGDLIVGSYRFNSSFPDGNPSPAVGVYEFQSPPFGISMNIGEMVFASNPQDVDFLIELRNDDNQRGSFLITNSSNLPVSNGLEFFQMLWQLEDDTGAALASDALFETAPVLTDWQNNLRITCDSNSRVSIRGTITDA